MYQIERPYTMLEEAQIAVAEAFRKKVRESNEQKIIELEKIFKCDQPDCKRPKVTLKNYDNVANKIRCGCDHTKYDWKK